MPTRLPARRNFLRRLTPDPETARNLKATIAEFGLAALFVTVTVLVIHLVSARMERVARTPTASTTTLK